jgi:tripartite-type tricarboxylate transporter receptor subunit TctC
LRHAADHAVVSQALTTSVSQPFVIDNRPGADGAIAARAARSAPADGYTLFFATSSVLALSLVTTPAPFNTLADFVPVSSVGRFAFCLYVHPNVAQSLGEFVVYARANPGKLNYASNNVAEHLAASQFMKAAGVTMVRVPYKGAAQAMPDLIAGRVQVNFGPMAAGLSHVKERRLRILATLLPERTALTPDIPTMAEAGFPGVSVQTYQMILAPAKTPGQITDRLSREVNLALQNAEVRSQLEKHALVVEGTTRERLAVMLRQGNRIWAQFFEENRPAQN